MLRRVAAFCRPLRPVLLLVSFPRSRSPVAPPAPSSRRPNTQHNAGAPPSNAHANKTPTSGKQNHVPPCDVTSFVGFLTGGWAVTRSSLHRVRRGSAVCWAMGLVRCVSFVCPPLPHHWSPHSELRIMARAIDMRDMKGGGG